MQVTESATRSIELQATAHHCPCGKFSAYECMGECGFNDLKPLDKSGESSAPSLASKTELAKLSWKQSPSNPFIRGVSPEMLTESGLQIIDRNSPRNSITPIEDRPKAIFVYDRTFVTASLARIFKKLECNALQFIELVCDACELPDDSPVRQAAGTDAVNFTAIAPISVSDNDNTLKKLLAYAQGIQAILHEYRALLPSPNDKGEYPIRYTHAVKLLERLENSLKFDTSLSIETIDHDQMKAKIKRL